MLQRKNFPLLFFSLILFLSITGYVTIHYVESRNDLPYFGNSKMALNRKEVEKNNITPIPSFSFINQDGKAITQDFIQGKVCVANFFFTRCGSICPKMSNHLQKIQSAFADNRELKMLSFSCDPEHDSPAQLKMYATSYHAQTKQWEFITGNKPELYRFARKGLFIAATDGGDGGADDFIHSQNIVLIDKAGFIRGYYDGTDQQSMENLKTDIKKLM